MAKEVTKTLEERGSNYGPYQNLSGLAQRWKDDLRSSPGWELMTPEMRESADLIVTKLARLACGNPKLPDSWHDIGGYAALAEASIPVKK